MLRDLPRLARWRAYMLQEVANVNTLLTEWDANRAGSEASITDVVSELESALRSLKDVCSGANNALKAARETQQAVISTARGRLVKQLPLELLAAIFELASCCDDERMHFSTAPLPTYPVDDGLSGSSLDYFPRIGGLRPTGRPRSTIDAMRISHVCRTWRNLALSLPKLWSIILVSDLTPLSKIRSLTDRSSPRPIMVYLTPTARHNRFIYPIIERLGTVAERWKSLRVHFLYPTERYITQIEKFTFPLLESIYVDGRPWVPPTGLPRLRTLYATPGDTGEGWSVVQSRLIGRLETVGGCLSLSDLNVLSRSSCLTTLTLITSLPLLDLLSERTFGALIVLEHVKTLILKQTTNNGGEEHDEAPILRHLSFPNLMHLTLCRRRPLNLLPFVNIAFHTVISCKLVILHTRQSLLPPAAMHYRSAAPALPSGSASVFPSLFNPTASSLSSDRLTNPHQPTPSHSPTSLIAFLKTMPLLETLTLSGCDVSLFTDLRDLTTRLNIVRHPLGKLVELNLLDCDFAAASGSLCMMMDDVSGASDGGSTAIAIGVTPATSVSSSPSTPVRPKSLDQTHKTTLFDDDCELLLVGNGRSDAMTSKAIAKASKRTRSQESNAHATAKFGGEILKAFLEMWSKGHGGCHSRTASSTSVGTNVRTAPSSPSDGLINIASHSPLRLSIRRCGVSDEFTKYLQSWWRGVLDIDRSSATKNLFGDE